MIKKVFLLLILVILSIAHAEEDCEINILNSDVKDFAEEISIPNCVTEKNLFLAYDGKPKSLCTKCKKKFLALSASQSASNEIDLKSQQKMFLDAALENYKKSIINNIVEVTKLRALPSTGIDYKNSVDACRMRSIGELTTGCKSSAGKALLQNSSSLKNFSKALSNELAYILSDTKLASTQDGLLDRRMNDIKCNSFVSEKDVLLLSNTVVEDYFTPAQIQKLKNLDSKNFETVDDLIRSGELTELYEIKDALYSHPLLSLHLKSPENLISFFKSLPSPGTTQDLKNELYGKRSGEMYNEKLALDCRESYEALKNSICSEEFEKGDFQISPFKNNNFMAEVNKLDPIDGKYVTKGNEIEKNHQAFAYCKLEDKKGNLDLSKTLESISTIDNPNLNSLSLSQYRLNKYDNEIGNFSNFICKANGNQCSEDTYLCKVYNKWIDVKKNDSLEAKLAKSSNPEINTLLRAMIGETKDLPPETKKVLISQGIIPDETGKITKQPVVAERRPGYFSTSSTASVSATPGTAAQYSARPLQADRPVSYGPAQARKLSETTPQDNSSFNSSILENMNDLSRINKEIARRLMESKPSSTVTRDDVKKATRDFFNDYKTPTSKQPTPAQVDKLADRFIEEVNKEMGTSTQFREGTARPSMSSKEVAAKRSRDQLNRALEGMGTGKDAVALNNAANDMTVKVEPLKGSQTLSKVEIYTSQGKLDIDKLSGMLKIKTEKDAEGKKLAQLVKKKQPFILIINKLSLMVKFEPTLEIHSVGSNDRALAKEVSNKLKEFLSELSPRVVTKR